MKTKVVILTSNEPWGPVWFSKHHYANELALKGHMVFFLNPQKKWKISNLLSLKVEEIVEENGVRIVDFKNNFPVVHPFFLFLNDVLNSWKIKKIIPKENNKTIWWQFDPFRFVTISFFKNLKRVYHVADEYLNLKTDLLLAKKATIIACTSHPHFLVYSKMYPSKSLYLPHGIASSEVINESNEVSENIILLIGTMNDDYDIRLLEEISENFLEFILTIIGPTTFSSALKGEQFENLISRSNVEYLGPVHSNKLKSHIGRSQICISPYRFDMKRIGSSLKILSYLSQYKPVVTSVIEGFSELEGKGVFEAKSSHEFVHLLRDILDEKISLNTQLVRSFLIKRTYDNLIGQIFNELGTQE